MFHQNLNIEGLYVRSGIISTFTGKYLDTRNPKPEEIDIVDIAWQLSKQPRFGGRLRQDYSVAQHCIECSFLTSTENALAALLHDASEAYICDIPSPVKSELPQYYQIEDRLMKAISMKFGFEYPVPKEVKEVDKYMLELEWSTLVKESHPHRITCLNQFKAFQTYLKVFRALTS